VCMLHCGAVEVTSLKLPFRSRTMRRCRHGCRGPHAQCIGDWTQLSFSTRLASYVSCACGRVSCDGLDFLEWKTRCIPQPTPPHHVTFSDVRGAGVHVAIIIFALWRLGFAFGDGVVPHKPISPFSRIPIFGFRDSDSQSIRILFPL
jgi:hypothetical protein